MGVIDRRQTGPDIQVLADPCLDSQVPDDPHEELAGGTGDVDDLGQHRDRLLTGLAVDRIVVLTAQPVVPDAGRMWHRSVDSGPWLAVLTQLICHAVPPPGGGYGGGARSKYLGLATASLAATLSARPASGGIGPSS